MENDGHFVEIKIQIPPPIPKEFYCKGYNKEFHNFNFLYLSKILPVIIHIENSALCTPLLHFTPPLPQITDLIVSNKFMELYKFTLLTARIRLLLLFTSRVSTRKNKEKEEISALNNDFKLEPRPSPTNSLLQTREL